MTWWADLNATAKKLVVLLPMIGLVGGWFVSFTTNIRVNAMALQRSIDAETHRQEKVDALDKKVMAAEADAASTKAATATSMNRITLMQEGQADVNAETARQVAALAKQSKENATQIAKTQEQLVRMSNLGNRIENLEKVSKKLSDEVTNLTRATTKLRKKVKDDSEESP